jgi:hypothetical protein
MPKPHRAIWKAACFVPFQFFEDQKGDNAVFNSTRQEFIQSEMMNDQENQRKIFIIYYLFATM